MFALVATLLLASWTPPALSDAVVHIETQPAGAIILLNGNLHCRETPCTRFVKPGEYVVTALHEDAQTTRQTVTIGLPEARLRLELTPKK